MHRIWKSKLFINLLNKTKSLQDCVSAILSCNGFLCAFLQCFLATLSCGTFLQIVLAMYSCKAFLQCFIPRHSCNTSTQCFIMMFSCNSRDSNASKKWPIKHVSGNFFVINDCLRYVTTIKTYISTYVLLELFWINRILSTFLGT